MGISKCRHCKGTGYIITKLCPKNWRHEYTKPSGARVDNCIHCGYNRVKGK